MNSDNNNGCIAPGCPRGNRGAAAYSMTSAQLFYYIIWKFATTRAGTGPAEQKNIDIHVRNNVEYVAML